VTLQVRDIDTFYGTSHILHGVSLDIADRELCAVLGRNGAGKTTLLRSITGVNPPADGSILLDGTEITHLKSHRRTRLGVSYVPQGREIIPDITVAENIYIALLGKGRKGNKVPTFVFDYFPALKLVINQKGGSSQLRGRWSRSLSFCSWTSRRKDCSHQSLKKSNRSLSAYPPNVTAPSSWSNKTSILFGQSLRNSRFSKRGGSSQVVTSVNSRPMWCANTWPYDAKLLRNCAPHSMLHRPFTAGTVLTSLAVARAQISQ
jgi:ABC-type sugar transport system ATPase subunit